MTLKARIQDDMRSAMRARDSARLEAIRLLRAAIQRREVDERTALDDEAVVSVIQKMIKQSQDAISQFQAGNRQDLVDKETSNIQVLEQYLPEQLDPVEIDALVRAAIAETGAVSMRDMGKVMAVLKVKVQGRGDMGAIGQQVKALLAG